MKKTLLFMILVSSVLLFSACTKPAELKSDCGLKCEAISNMCSTITQEECEKKCDDCNDMILNEIKGENDCNKAKETISQCNSVKEEQTGNNCEEACHNYNNQCLIHVPNADQKLFDEGFESCMDICKDWATEKIECMVNAKDCPSMTEVCGL